jgi:LCP family protein required for cell wall assembly
MNQPVDLNKKEPFSVLLLGIDTGDLGRTEQGRSDTLMVATVNPNDNKTTLVSIPRDTYVDIVGYGTQDKINHAYAFGGAAMSMDTVEKYLDIPIDHYVSINMMGIKELVDAVGGVDVNNDLEFTQDGHQYAFGPIHLNGEEALGYIRMRYEDPRGDYGRQLRQRAIVEAVVKKVLTLDGVTQYRNILDAVEGNMKTDLSFSNMQKIALDYRGAFTTIDQLQMQGDGFMQDGISYQRVSENELNSVQNQLKKQLDTK